MCFITFNKILINLRIGVYEGQVVVSEWKKRIFYRLKTCPLKYCVGIKQVKWALVLSRMSVSSNRPGIPYGRIPRESRLLFIQSFCEWDTPLRASPRVIATRLSLKRYIYTFNKPRCCFVVLSSFRVSKLRSIRDKWKIKIKL